MATPPEYRQADDERESLTLRDYLGVLWRRKWIIILVTVVATVAAFGFSYRQAKVYEAQADLIYEQQLDVANPLTGQTYTDPTQRVTGAQLGQRHHPEPHHHATAPPRILEAQGLPTIGLRGPGRGGAGRDRDRHADVQRRLRDRHERRRGVLGGRGADLRRRVRGLAQGAHEQPDRRGHRRDRARRCATTRARPRSPPDYLILQQRLRDLQILKATATGNFRVLVPATVPESPIAPKPLRSAILGFGVGLFAGIGLAFLLEQFDTRVRRPDDVAALLRQPVLARVPRLSREQMKSPTARDPRAPRRPRRRVVPSAAHQPRLHGRRRHRQVAARHQQPAGRGQERHDRQPRRDAGARRQEGHRRGRRPQAPAPAQAVRPRERGRREQRGRRRRRSGRHAAVRAGGLAGRQRLPGGLHQLDVRHRRGHQALGAHRAAPSRPTPARSSPRSGSPGCWAGCATSATCSSSTRRPCSPSATRRRWRRRWMG